MQKSQINSETTHGNFQLEKVLKDLFDETLGRYPGNIYYAVKSTEDYYANFYNTFYKKYQDNSVTIHNSIQAAVDAATADRGDLVLVMPGKWQENVLVFEKDSLKIRAVMPGWETQMRPGDGATKYPMTTPGGVAIPGFAFVILSRSVELSGFCLDEGGGYGGAYIGDGYRIDTDYGENSASANIHDNYFRGGGEGLVGALLDGASDDVHIDDNIFSQMDVGVQLDPGGDRTTQRPVIRRNEFFAENAGYGIDMYSSATTVGALVRGNTFRDGASAAFTYGVRFQGAGVHTLAGNFFACANKWSGAAGDFISGNFGANGADGTEVVSEA